MFIRYDQPILTANPKNEWENLVATNPGAWYDEENQEVILLYRAAGNDAAHTISIGLAKSKDGIHFERVSDKPVLYPSKEGHFDAGGTEDPRLVKFGDWYFITYACVPLAPGRYWENGLRLTDPTLPEEAPWTLRTNNTKTALAITRDFKTVHRVGFMTDPTVDDRDVIIFPEKINGKFYTLHRPAEWVGGAYGCEKASIWISACDDLLEQKKLQLLCSPRNDMDWEFYKIGGSTPPVRTDYGWLTLYHGVGKDAKYRVGALILDLQDPTKVLYRTDAPILEPLHPFENEGIYKGICFPCGNVVMDDNLYIYYGAADMHVGVAVCNLEALMQRIMNR